MMGSEMVRTLGDYAARGGGVWIVLGSDMNMRSYNRTLLPALIPMTLRSPVGNVGGSECGSAVRGDGFRASGVEGFWGKRIGWRRRSFT
jgi:hypothetical protein